MPPVTLAAGRWWDDAGRLAEHDLVLTPIAPRLSAADPRRLFLTGTVAGTGEFIKVQVERHALPPEQTGPEREDAEPGAAYQHGDPVWVWSTLSRLWCPGTVDRASPIALQVTYKPAGQRGTASDAVPPCYVARRQEATVKTEPAPG